MSGIYHAYDVRGVFPDELNNEIAYKIAQAYAEWLIAQKPGKDLKIVVGCDMRVSSPSLVSQVISGLQKQGVEVLDVGLLSSPTFYFAVSYLKADGGMQVTASHNPKEYNGIKMVREMSLPVGYDTGINEIERMVNENNFPHRTPSDKISQINNILAKEVEYSFTRANISQIKPLKIVADPANAMGSTYLDKLFDHLPGELVRINFDLDGTFPAHEADPFKLENTKELRERVISEKADLGIATDGDGDRVFFIDDKGEMVDPAILRGLVASLVLEEHPGATICYDIRPGRITRDMILDAGGKPSVTRVGHSLIKLQAIKEKAPFAGESSGHYFFDSEYGFYEMPMILILKILQYISRENKSFSEIVAPLKKYFHSGEINRRVEEETSVILERVSKHFADGKQSRLDGLTVEYEDFWFNIRASNTEPVLRLNLEAKNEKIMKEKSSEVLSLYQK